MVGLRRNSSPATHFPNKIHYSPIFESTSTADQGDSQGASSSSGGGGSTTNMTGVSAPKSTTESAGSASPSVWRKTSHPPLHFNNNESRNRNLQLQLKNRGTKDDWGASLRYDIDPQTSTSLDITKPMNLKLDDLTETCSIESDSSIQTPVLSPSLYERFIVLSDNLTALVKCIMDEAKKNTGAESCSLFLIDEEKHELAAKMFDNGGGVEEIRVPWGHGVVGRVANTLTIMNIRDAQRCPFFYENVDEKTGFKTRNMLCFPIVDNAGLLIGVGELCNKISADGSGFTKFDEKYAKSFSLYCANSISHCVFTKKILEISARAHMVDEMLIQGENAVIEEVDIMRLVNDPLRDWRYFSQHFSDFSFAPRSIGENHFHRASMMFFEDLGFTMKYRINKRKLSYMMLRISAGYRPVPYHNWSHAFAVTHFCWLMLRTEACQRALGDLERLALLISCLCHDIDHRGTTNSFQLQSKTPLSQLYSCEGSVLERHHYAQTLQILHKEECMILEHLDGTQFRLVLSNIREVILATDIANHLKKVDRLHGMVDVGYNPVSVDHHYLLMCLIMTASDLSDQSKNFRNAKMIAENIYKEFFAQGDSESQIGVKPLDMMDRHTAYVPQVQLEFLDSIGLPVFEMLASIIPDGKTTYEAICANRLCWKVLHDDMQNKGQPNELGYLRDENVERRIIDKVRKVDPRAAEIASRRFEPVYANGSVPAVNDILDHRFDGYDKEYQDYCFVSNHNNNSSKKQVVRSLTKPKKATDEDALLKPSDNGCETTTRRAARTPRRLWRRARQLISSVSSSCASCSPLPSRRQVSEDSESG